MVEYVHVFSRDAGEIYFMGIDDGGNITILSRRVCYMILEGEML